jgi:hypothetical protein
MYFRAHTLMRMWTDEIVDVGLDEPARSVLTQVGVSGALGVTCAFCSCVDRYSRRRPLPQ